MQMAAFKAVCPLELGDTVAIMKPKEKNGNKQAFYLPENANIIIAGSAELHKVSDILTMHYLRNKEVQFLYELDNSGHYEPLDVKMPVMQYAEALRNREK